MAYNVTDLTSRIQRKAKDTSFSATLIAEFLDEVQTDVLGDQFSQLLEKTETATLSINDTTRAYPADHQATMRLWLVDTSTTPDHAFPLTYLPHDQFFGQYPSPTLATASQPRTWTDFGGTIYFSSPLDKAYGLRHDYLRVPGTLSAGGDVPDIPQAYQGILIYGVLSKIEAYRDNHDLAAIHERKKEDLAEQMQMRYALRQFGETVTESARSRPEVDAWGD